MSRVDITTAIKYGFVVVAYFVGILIVGGVVAAIGFGIVGKAHCPAAGEPARLHALAQLRGQAVVVNAGMFAGRVERCFQSRKRAAGEAFNLVGPAVEGAQALPFG